jgi:psp operon transcriptional activator
MSNPERIIGHSGALARTLEQLSDLAGINRPVLILGERGTGKELAAERLHYLSGRWDAPLLKVNCAAIADTLLESELFGHEPGAFTGATRTHRGRFERADGGTLFLDELATMSPRLQEKLLRLVEYGEFERLGGQKTLQVDVRVVAATNADLRALADAGEFRADLLDRLSFDVVHLPPLRRRTGDIGELAQHFAVAMSAELGWALFPGFTDAAMARLERHDWPGNIRELKNAVERSLFRWGDQETPVDQVVVDPFVSPFVSPFGKIGEDAIAVGDGPAPETGLEHTTGGTADEPGATSEAMDFHAHIAEIEQRLLGEALAAHGHHQRRTADALGLTYDQMRGLVRKYKLALPRSG